MRERTGHLSSYAKAKKMKLLTHHTMAAFGLALGIALLLLKGIPRRKS